MSRTALRPVVPGAAFGSAPLPPESAYALPPLSGTVYAAGAYDPELTPGPDPERDAEQGGMLYLDDRTEGEAPVVRAVNQIVAQAIQEGASDVHIEPYREGLYVRFRVDGLMFDRFALRQDLAAPLLSRIKIISHLNVAERRLPQDGRFTVVTRGNRFDVRVSVAPGVLGEKAVLRLLPKDSRSLGLEDLGLQGDNLRCLENLVQRPHGMVLVTGPTGSGKTTTLYAALRRINTVVRNTVTIEDPVEYELPRVTQMQVHPKIGLTFAAGLRSILRQDPDVVMVGEIRDAETLSIAIQAALTGHLVLSTLHCNDAAGAAARCIDMGTEPFLLSSSISAIVAQRLIRKICSGCREQRELPRELRRTLDLPEDGTYCAGRGCEACRGTGYKGRTAVFEVMRLSPQVKSAIHAKEASSVIRTVATAEGMQTMRVDAVAKMRAGITTPEEVLRAVYLEGDHATDGA